MRPHKTSKPRGRARLFGMDSHRRKSSRSRRLCGVVHVSGAGVIGHVAIEELDVTGHERHLVAELLRHLGEEVQRLVLGGRERRHAGQPLRRPPRRCASTGCVNRPSRRPHTGRA